MRLLTTWAALLSCTLLAPACGVQEPPAKQEQAPRIRVGVELVNVDATVSDARGNFVPGLKRENFRILDDGIEQKITNFAAVEEPARVLVLVETGPAVYLLQKQHLAAAGALLEGLAANDRVALGTYNESARLALNLTDDKLALARALDHLQYGLGMADLNFYASLATALDWLAPVPGKKAVVLLTTGLDSSAAANWEGLLAKLRASDVMVLAVALGGELRSAGKPSRRQAKKQAKQADSGADNSSLSFQRADRALETMAEETGGRAYFPRDASEFPAIYRQIASLLRNTYSLGFAPAARDGRMHNIEVQVVDERGQPLASNNGKPRYNIRARSGYFSLAP
jgi:VWFA-related protein